jgi:lysophospholipase L1-like esterase
MVGWLLRAIGGLAITLLFAELLLRAGSLVAYDRSDVWRDGSSVRVLCIGDSHTFGTGVARDEAYPARLQHAFDELQPGRYSVLNLGVPGMSTTQLKHRLPAYAARYNPEVLIVWAGINNLWNLAEIDDPEATWRTWLTARLHALRIYRFVRVWQHARSLEAAAAQPPGVRGVERAFQRDATWTLGHGDATEQIRHQHGDVEVSAALRRIRDDYAEMAQWAQSAGIRLYAIVYPHANIREVNDAIRAIAAERGIPLIDSQYGVDRVPFKWRKFLWALHPNARMYEEIARDVASAVAAE